MLKLSIYLCCLCALTSQLVLAMTAEQKAQIHAHFETIGKRCISSNIISEEDIADLRAKNVPTGPNVPCFLACVMKDIGVMDDTGLLQKETALELAKSVFENPEEIKNIEDYLHSCAYVNNENVSDGNKGCERAMLSYKCMRENASKFGFDV